MTRRKFSDAELAAFPVSKQKAIQRQRRHVERKATMAAQASSARSATDHDGELLPKDRMDAVEGMDTVEADMLERMGRYAARIYLRTKDELMAVGKWNPSLCFVAASYAKATAAISFSTASPSGSLIAQQLAAVRQLKLDELPTAKKRSPVPDRFKF